MIAPVISCIGIVSALLASSAHTHPHPLKTPAVSRVKKISPVKISGKKTVKPQKAAIASKKKTLPEPANNNIPENTPAAATSSMVVDAHPALWMIHKNNTTIYLFGTIHMLDPRYSWFKNHVRDAFEQSSELVIETKAPPADQVQAIVSELATDKSGLPLEKRLPPALNRRVQAELAHFHIAKNSMDRFSPWFVAVTLTLLHYQKSGIKTMAGVEPVLIAQAQSEAKNIGELEDFKQQLSFLSNLSSADQISFLQSSLEEDEQSSFIIRLLIKAWAGGDEDRLANIVNQNLSQIPHLQTILLENRNRRWADWIENRLKTPGTVFMAVGAGHLGGAHSLRKILAERQIYAVRIAN
ncbi:MAG: TraB/GumN family protein [Zymomonas mobilis]|uniref:TraB/GumN family protein n=1 Tax=Zymomonas mobilis TaxID=542 RepID=UPI0001B705A5|nr:TraB/GumN family protein [Zymomonas mobilis]ACV76277.1 GumN family protein [Zymomonas mobilis subsp. mobilis NCIMB 11163]MCP9307999.1 TraB/GumN family protein [Zymomonas mobilis]